MYAVVGAHGGKTRGRIVPQPIDEVATQVFRIKGITIEGLCTHATIGSTIHVGRDTLGGRCRGPLIVTPLTVGLSGKRNLEDRIVGIVDHEVTLLDKHILIRLGQGVCARRNHRVGIGTGRLVKVLVVARTGHLSVARGTAIHWAQRVATCLESHTCNHGPASLLGDALHTIREGSGALHLRGSSLEVGNDLLVNLVAAGDSRQEVLRHVGRGKRKGDVAIVAQQLIIAHGTYHLGLAQHLREVGMVGPTILIYAAFLQVVDKLVGCLDGTIEGVPQLLRAAGIGCHVESAWRIGLWRLVGVGREVDITVKHHIIIQVTPKGVVGQYRGIDTVQGGIDLGRRREDRLHRLLRRRIDIEKIVT